MCYITHNLIIHPFHTCPLLFILLFVPLSNTLATLSLSLLQLFRQRERERKISSSSSSKLPLSLIPFLSFRTEERLPVGHLSTWTFSCYYYLLSHCHSLSLPLSFLPLSLFSPFLKVYLLQCFTSLFFTFLLLLCWSDTVDEKEKRV